jgi:glycosyltransferase involved in cell wall biosynthesis
VYIGRIIPEKRITNLIGIVEKARSATSLPITFHLAGRLDQTPKYGEMLAAMAQERDWLKFVGVQYGDEKSRFLMSGTFAIHAERDEAFGIAVAEYLVAGLIPIVPDEGGTPEVVNSPALSYHTDDDAACILVRLATDDSFREEQRRLCAERAQFFSKDAYLARQGEMLRKIMAG